MIEQLFGSKTRVKLLQLFYSNPNRPFYVREITRKIDEQINSVRRELSNLLNIGIISSENTNNRLYYEVNKTFQFYEPLSQIFGSAAAVASGDENNEALAALRSIGHVDLALLTGQFTRDEKSGVDFLLIGDINQTQLAKYITDLEAKEGKAIRYVVMTKDEFIYRRQINDRFLISVIDSKKHVIIDKDGLIEGNTVALEPAEPAQPPKSTPTKKEKVKK
jgi:hypothetical protein